MEHFKLFHQTTSSFEPLILRTESQLGLDESEEKASDESSLNRGPEYSCDVHPCLAAISH